MKYKAFSLVGVAIFVASTAATCIEIGGNWFCNETKGITYTNFGRPGTYQKVTHMSEGQCNSSTQAFSGGMSPLDQDISWHFRGPLRLKQFAYYTVDEPLKQDVPTTGGRPSKRYEHERLHDLDIKPPENNKAAENGSIRAVDKEGSQGLPIAPAHGKLIQRQSTPAMITATINGQIVSWPASAMSVPHIQLTSSVTSSGAPAMITATINGQTVSWSAHNPATEVSTVKSLVTVTVTKRPSPIATTTTTPSGLDADKWNRKGYYNAKDQIAENIVFLNNRGGQGSGVFDLTWGASLSYASSDAKGGSTTPQILADILLEDNNEFAIFSSRSCNDTSCGTTRPNTVAYHGFDGRSKLFLLEFGMPLSGLRSPTLAPDTPAAWILNAQIPRTMQYGPIECSCWATGCGEWDIFEVLDPGNTRCKSTYQGGAGRSGGDSNWFARPVGEPVKIAVLFDGALGQGSIVTLPDDVVFEYELADEVLRGWINSFAGDGSGTGRKIALPG